MIEILQEVREGLVLPYIGDAKVVDILQNCPGLLITYREFDGVLQNQMIAPFEMVNRYLVNAIGREGFTYGDHVAEWGFDNGMTIYARRLPNTVCGSPSCRIRVESAPESVKAALQEAPTTRKDVPHDSASNTDTEHV